VRPYTRRLRIWETNFGREGGWLIERQGEVIAVLTDCRFEDMFWDSYRMDVITSNPELRLRMQRREFWGASASEGLVWRSRDFGEVAYGAFPALSPFPEPGRLTMRHLYLPIPEPRPWDWLVLAWRRRTQRHAEQNAAADRGNSSCLPGREGAEVAAAAELRRSARGRCSMFGWFSRRRVHPSQSHVQPVDRILRAGIDALVLFFHADPPVDDDITLHHLTYNGLSEEQATKLIQFVPIAFTRFLYRDKGIQFAPNYVVLGPDGRPIAQRLIADEPAFREAWWHCEEAASRGVTEEYFVIVAARSGGYRAIQDLIRKGSNLACVVTGPPVMVE
jgi:hypothetical protein